MIVLPLVLALVAVSHAASVTDCPNTLPDGTLCPADHDNIAHTYEDPEDCSSYYECWNGCMAHLQCKSDYLYDSFSDICTKQEDVVCGDRPCNDPIHCDHPGTTPPPDCGHIKNCTDVTDGYYPDEWNCRKYWICRGGKGEHHTCPNDNQGKHMMYDLVYDGCNYIAQTDCGDRPDCDDCDENCVQPTTPGPSGNCAHHDCSADSSPDGFYAEGDCENTYCRCVGGVGYLQHCSPGLVFYEPKIQCDWPYNVPGCQ